MSKRPELRCGNCVFSKKYEGDPSGKQVMCVFGGSINGPYNRYKAACFAYSRKIVHTRKKKQLPADDTEVTTVPTPEYVWTARRDNTLVKMYLRGDSIISISQALEADIPLVASRIKALRINRPKPQKPPVVEESIPDGNPIPASEQKHVGYRPCTGQCCKYKETCRHYLRFVELGKPILNLIQSVSQCINYSYNSISETQKAYKHYISITGSRVPDPIYYTETC